MKLFKRKLKLAQYLEELLSKSWICRQRKITIGDKTYKTLRFNFSSSDPSLSKDKKLNTDIWYEEGTYLWVKAAFDKTGYWEYRLKKVK